MAMASVLQMFFRIDSIDTSGRIFTKL